ncbi:MAG TPA: hypothetical protein ENK24_02115 [Anaerolineae bacterium]|nr:hypothetical protein [Anaerolineae bacterium]
MKDEGGRRKERLPGRSASGGMMKGSVSAQSALRSFILPPSSFRLPPSLSAPFPPPLRPAIPRLIAYNKIN